MSKVMQTFSTEHFCLWQGVKFVKISKRTTLCIRLKDISNRFFLPSLILTVNTNTKKSSKMNLPIFLYWNIITNLYMFIKTEKHYLLVNSFLYTLDNLVVVWSYNKVFTVLTEFNRSQENYKYKRDFSLMSTRPMHISGILIRCACSSTSQKFCKISWDCHVGNDNVFSQYFVICVLWFTITFSWY